MFRCFQKHILTGITCRDCIIQRLWIYTLLRDLLSITDLPKTCRSVSLNSLPQTLPFLAAFWAANLQSSSSTSPRSFRLFSSCVLTTFFAEREQSVSKASGGGWPSPQEPGPLPGGRRGAARPWALPLSPGRWRRLPAALGGPALTLSSWGRRHGGCWATSAPRLSPQQPVGTAGCGHLPSEPAAPTAPTRGCSARTATGAPCRAPPPPPRLPPPSPPPHPPGQRQGEPGSSRPGRQAGSPGRPPALTSGNFSRRLRGRSGAGRRGAARGSARGSPVERRSQPGRAGGAPGAVRSRGSRCPGGLRGESGVAVPRETSRRSPSFAPQLPPRGSCPGGAESQPQRVWKFGGAAGLQVTGGVCREKGPKACPELPGWEARHVGRWFGRFWVA